MGVDHRGLAITAGVPALGLASMRERRCYHAGDHENESERDGDRWQPDIARADRAGVPSTGDTPDRCHPPGRGLAGAIAPSLVLALPALGTFIWRCQLHHTPRY